MAKSINAAYDDEIVITSGGTESDNTAIKQTALARASEGRHIITTRFEHEAILRPLEDLERQGYEVTYLDVDENGQIDLAELKRALRPDTILVSIMTVNNEVAVICQFMKSVRSWHQQCLVPHRCGSGLWNRANRRPKRQD